MNSSLELFNELNQKTLVYGAEKYKFSNTKESTDELFDIHGANWLFGTCHKYVLRFSNVERERDLLKIATYCYILWLKKGFHISTTGLSKTVDTAINVKIENFPDFLSVVLNYFQKNEFYLNNLISSDALTKIGNMFKCFSFNEWEDITEDKLLHIYCLAYIIWNLHFYKQGLGGKDTDVDVEKAKMKEKLLNSAILFFEGSQWLGEDLILLVENQMESLYRKN